MFTNNGHSINKGLGKLTVVKTTPNIEREVDGHVKSIQAIISTLTPIEKQKYFNGLLAYILNEQIEMNEQQLSKTISKKDFSKLSYRELSLIEEMSGKMQELYRLTGDTEE